MGIFSSTEKHKSDLDIWLENLLFCNTIVNVLFFAGSNSPIVVAIALLIAFVITSRFIGQNESFRLFVNSAGLLASLAIAFTLTSRLSPETGRIYFGYIIGLMILSAILIREGILFRRRPGRPSRIRERRMLVRGLAGLTTISTALFYMLVCGPVSHGEPYLYYAGLVACMAAVAFFRSEILSLIIVLFGCIGSVYIAIYIEEFPKAPLALILALCTGSFIAKTPKKRATESVG